MSRVLALSPHLGDAVFSAGATIATLADAGHHVVLATAFTATVPGATGFALRSQTDKGIPPEVDYMALRRREDRRAAMLLGVSEVLHLGLPEAPHRGYASLRALTGPPRDDDPAAEAVGTSLAGIGSFDLVLAPLGLGDHVDHRQLLRAIGAGGQRTETPAVLSDLGPVTRWRDLPAALRERTASRWEEPVEIGPDALERKLDVCGAYGTQLGALFCGAVRMRRTLREFAVAEGRALGPGRPAECFRHAGALRALMPEHTDSGAVPGETGRMSSLPTH